jgi:hypothetical protein
MMQAPGVYPVHHNMATWMPPTLLARWRKRGQVTDATDRCVEHKAKTRTEGGETAHEADIQSPKKMMAGMEQKEG